MIKFSRKKGAKAPLLIIAFKKILRRYIVKLLSDYLSNANLSKLYKTIEFSYSHTIPFNLQAFTNAATPVRTNTDKHNRFLNELGLKTI